MDEFKEQLFQLVKKDRKDKPLLGRKAETKKLYRDPEAEEAGIFAFTEHAPVQFADPRREKHEGYAIIKFTDKAKGIIYDRHSTQKTTNIKIQSPILCRVLEPLLRPYDLDSSEGSVFISSPFEPLFFHRDDIYRLSLEYEEGSEERQHLEHLIEDVLQQDLWELIKETEDLEKENKATWHKLWTLFPRGSLVIAKGSDGSEQAYQVLDSDYKDEDGVPLFYDIKCQSVRFNGVQFGFEESYRTIPHFTGKKNIADLDVYPLRLAKKAEYLRKRLLERGKRVLDFQDVRHVEIKPATVDESRPNYDEVMKDLGRGDVHGRAIIDFYTAAKRNPRWNKALRPLEESPFRKMESAGKGKGPETLIESRPRHITIGVDGSVKRPSKEAQAANTALLVRDEDNLVLMDPLLHAFSLKSREWTSVNVDSISPAAFTDAAFEHLVADETFKNLLLALVESQKIISDIPEDPIPEKGRGLLVLLSGPPGTGKTLMAETIAEKARRPLYYVDARDLGASFSKIADNFKIIMENACEWNAIVLLDEADIYLQQRSTSASDGNERVTAFLRQLEYFQGILFMTTNLFDTLDKAVESRIHIHIPFRSLPYEDRAQIWDHFLKLVPSSKKDINPADINRLAFWTINGRQIKNAFRMTLAYCRQQGDILTRQILEDMVRLTCPHAQRESTHRDVMMKPDQLQPDEKGSATSVVLPNRSSSWLDRLSQSRQISPQDSLHQSNSPLSAASASAAASSSPSQEQSNKVQVTPTRLAPLVHSTERSAPTPTGRQAFSRNDGTYSHASSLSLTSPGTPEPRSTSVTPKKAPPPVPTKKKPATFG